MELTSSFFLRAALLGSGLAMDAFSVSLANGLGAPKMGLRRICAVAGTFAGFQILMPLLGWIGVDAMASRFEIFHRFVPWIALLLLLYIGSKMVVEGFTAGGGEKELDAGSLMVQGVATSIDALSAGFTMEGLTRLEVMAEALIIGAVTFVICFAGVLLGKRFGTALAGKASVLGGAILIIIGIEIFVTH